MNKSNIKKWEKFVSLLMSIIILVLLTLLILSLSRSTTVSHTSKVIKPNPNKQSLFSPEEEQCFSTLNGNEFLELRDLYLQKKGVQFIKKDPNINVCIEYFKYKENKSPIKKETLPLMHFARGVNQKTIKLPNNDVLIIGGDKTDTITVELFDNKKKQFQEITNNLNQYLNHNISTLKEPFFVNNQYIYYRGALYDIEKKQFVNNKNELINKIDSFDQLISSKEWQNKTKLKFYKLFENGKVLFVSNCDNDYRCGCDGLKLIDPIADKSYLEGSFKNRKNSFEVVFLNDETILIIGGYGYHSNGYLLRFNYIEAYNPKTGKVSLRGKLDSDFNFNPSFYYPSDLYPNNNVYRPLILKNNLLIPGYNWDKSFLYKYNIDSKQVINKYPSPFYTLVQNEPIKNLRYPIQHVMYPIGTNNLLYIPDTKNTFNTCNRRCVTCLIDLNKEKECTVLNYFQLFYPFQALTPLDNGEILVTGGVKCLINKANRPFSKEAYLLKLEENSNIK